MARDEGHRHPGLSRGSPSAWSSSHESSRSNPGSLALGLWKGRRVPERLCCPVDAYMLLERGSMLLMLRRAPNAAYAASLLCPPSGHCRARRRRGCCGCPGNGGGTGIHLKPGQLRCAVVIHHRSPSGQARLGWFFTAERGWAGDPVNREPSKHAELAWIDPGAPPPDMVAYTWAGLTAWRSGAQFAVHWQDPGSPVHYDPGYEHELTLLPAESSHPASPPGSIRPLRVPRASDASIDVQLGDLVGDPSDPASGCHVRRMSMTCWPTVAQICRTTPSAAGCKSRTLDR